MRFAVRPSSLPPLSGRERKTRSSGRARYFPGARQIVGSPARRAASARREAKLVLIPPTIATAFLEAASCMDVSISMPEKGTGRNV